jgi:hypothetical protein
MRSLLRQFAAAALIAALSAAPLFAQQGAPVSESGHDGIDIIRSLDTGKLAIILIFGSGIIGTLGYSIAGIIRAFNGTRDDTEDLTTRLDALEDRLEQLEAQSKTPAQV